MAKRIIPISRIDKIEAEIDKIPRDVFLGDKGDFVLGGGWEPLVDIYEKGRLVNIEVELPGVEREDVAILLHSNKVEIKGTKREKSVGVNILYHRLEREFGLFRRLLFLPCIVVPETAKATLEKGILTITISKYTK